MVRYDSGVLQEYVDSLYSKAQWIAAQYALGGAMIGLIVGWTIQELAKASLGESSAPVIICVLISAVIGFAYGRGKGFEYRLRAQTLLCQMQIECNTRKG